MSPSGSQSPTHPTISEEILIYFVAQCFSFLQLKYSTIKTYQDPCCFVNGQPFLRLQTILKAVKKSQDNVVKPRLPITAEMLSKMCNVLRSGFLGPYEDLVLETALCLAFFRFLRCGEFTSQSNTFDPVTYLSIGDIQFHIHEKYFSLQLKRSKTDFAKG